MCLLGLGGYASPEAILFLGSEAECYDFLHRRHNERLALLKRSPQDEVADTTLEVKLAWPSDKVDCFDEKAS